MRKATRVISRQAKEGAEMASPWRPVPGPGEGGEDEHMLLQLREMLQQEQTRRTQLEHEVADAQQQLAALRAELSSSQDVERRTRHLALHDSLTALPNRGYFLQRLQEVLATSPLKARLFAWTEAVGWRRFCRQQGLAVPASPWSAFDGWVWPLLDKLAAQPLLAQFGGRLRVAVSGGAPLSPAVARCFLGVGMPLVQGYGMTETSPVVACNLPADNDPATVGRALPGVEVRIGENRELQVRGPSVMKGYLNRPEDTAKVLSAEGWLGTGDQAAIEQGRIRILGRIKEIIVTSTGEKVPPGDLELALMGDPLFEQAFVLGEQRPFIAAVVVMNPQVWAQLAQSLQLDPKDPASLQAPAAVKAALARIQQAAASFPHYAVPRKVWLTLEPWTIENTMMTPTLKLKRNNLMSRFAAEIERLYAR